MQPAANDLSLAATPFPGHVAHRIAKNANGDAIILIRVPGEARRLTPLRTENLRVVYSAPHQVRSARGAVDQEIFTSLTCLSPQPSLVRYFFEVIGTLLDTLGAAGSAESLDQGIRSIVRLFEALVLPSSASAQGLWAEMFLIATSRDRELAARAWHASPEERADFAMGPERVEVKSSGRRERRHHFSLEQLTPPRGTRVWIASVFTERSSGGASLERILSEACDGLSSEFQGRIQHVVAETLGAGFGNALELSFDRELAEKSLRFYESSIIPKPSLPLPEGVSEVHFESDLTSVAPIANASEGGALLAAFSRPD